MRFQIRAVCVRQSDLQLSRDIHLGHSALDQLVEGLIRKAGAAVQHQRNRLHVHNLRYTFKVDFGLALVKPMSSTNAGSKAIDVRRANKRHGLVKSDDWPTVFTPYSVFDALDRLQLTLDRNSMLMGQCYHFPGLR